MAGSQSVAYCEQAGGPRRSSDASSMGVGMEFQRQGTPLCPGISRPRLESTTLCAKAELLILQCVAWNNLKLVSGNIKTAFLSGDEEQDVRDDSEAQLKLCWWDRMQRSLLSDSHPAD